MHTEALVNAAFLLENKQRKLVRQNEAQTEIQHILNKYKYSLDFFQSFQSQSFRSRSSAFSPIDPLNVLLYQVHKSFSLLFSA